MKYIRTKDIIFELSYEENGYLYTINGEIGCKPNEVIAQADTIEELVDKYVCVEPNGEHTVLPSNVIISIIGTIIYGAIWTEKGLIYVAKMNEKGELELL